MDPKTETPQEVQQEVETTVETLLPAKPKRVLTEAQRLAFMKGREKRMANLERKRQEKAEAAAADYVPEPAPETPPPNVFTDEFVDAVAERLAAKMKPPPPAPKKRAPRKPRTPRPIPVEEEKLPDPPVVEEQQHAAPHPTQLFKWV